jgi:hypothetical protein
MMDGMKDGRNGMDEERGQRHARVATLVSPCVITSESGRSGFSGFVNVESVASSASLSSVAWRGE